MASRNRWELHDTRKSTYYSTLGHFDRRLPPTERVLRVQQPKRNSREQRDATVPLNSFNIHVLIYRPIRAPAAFKFSLSSDCWKSTNESWAVCFMKVSSLVISKYFAHSRPSSLPSFFLVRPDPIFLLRSRCFVPHRIRFIMTSTKPFIFANSVSCNISPLKIFNLIFQKHVNQIFKILNTDIYLSENNLIYYSH